MPPIDAPDTLAVRVDAVTAVRDPERSLARDSVAFFRTIALSVGIQGPTAGVIIGPAIIASVVGAPGGLAQVLGLITMGFIAYAFVTFSRSFNTASSVYGYNGTAMGPSYGFLSAWILLLVYTSFAAGVYAATADIAQTFFASIGLHGWWFWFALVGAILTIACAYLSIALSSILIFLFEGVAIILILVVGVVVLAKGGYHHHAFSGSPFELHGVTFGVLALGVVAVFGQFSGFEGAATLGEESRRATTTIPRAVVGSLILSAAVYIFFTWIVYNAEPSVKAVANDPAPLVSIANSYVSSTVGKIVNFAGLISGFGAQLACVNAASRLLFSLGREAGGGQRASNFLVRTDRKRRSPTGSLAVIAVVSLVGLAAFSFESTANRAATFIIQYGAYLILVAYAMTVLAALVWVIRRHPRPIPIGILTTGVAVIGFVLYKTFVPFPGFPFNRVVIAAAASALGGVVFLAIPGFYRRLSNSDLLRVTRLVTLDAIDEPNLAN